MKFELKTTFKEVFLTFLTEAIVLVAFLFIYRLIAKQFGPEGLGEYSLVKRVIGFFLPLLMLGIWVGVPRYVAMTKNQAERSSYLKAGWLVVTTFTFIFLIFVNSFKEYFAKIFFGNISYVDLIMPFSFFLAGSILHTFNYAYLRGKLLVKIFNSLQIINLSLAPLAILLLFQNITIDKLIGLIGIATFGIALFSSLFFIKDFLSNVSKEQFKESFKKLIYYSFPRFPSNFAMAGLMSLGAIFAAHFTSIEEVGYLSVSQQLLGAAGIVLAPLGVILLPKISNLISQEREEIVRENVNFIIVTILYCFIFVSAQSLIFTDVVIEYWLGQEFISALPIMRIVFFSLVFYAFFSVMANILDAIKIKPLNTINIFISLGAFLLMTGILFLFNFSSPIISLSIAFAIGMICLGTLTYFSIRKIYPENPLKDINHLLVAVGINILLGGVAIFVKNFIISRFYYLILFEVLLFLIYLLILWLLKIDWIRKLPQKIMFNTN